MHRVPYRIKTTNGKFKHVRATADEAHAIACSLAGAPITTDVETLRKHWGVTIKRISTQDAPSFGL